VSSPQDPWASSPFSYDPLGRPPPPPPPVYAPPPPPPPSPRVNPLATLSLIFAFVFAPAGAVLGHLGLAQIRRTGELGRDRALVGIVLSYALIASTVVALGAWAVVVAVAPAPTRTAAPTPTATAAPPPPAVEPAAIATLLPNLDGLKGIADDQNLEAGQSWDHPSRSDREGTIDRAECWGSIAPGTPDAYTVGAILGYHAQEFSDTRSFLKSVQVIQAAAAFRDPPTAQAQLAKLLSGWRDCGGTTVRVTIPGTGPIPFALGNPTDAGNGISTLDLAPKDLHIRSARAIAAKANVVIDLYVSCSGTTDGERPRQVAVSIANYVLNKIPG
jgi:hypothetical protein